VRAEVVAAAVVSLALLVGTKAGADQQEAAIGQQVYTQVQASGTIVARPSPLYDVMDPIALRIARVADPLYDAPFAFVIIHDASPNAFAVPGGVVYVTDSLFHFVQNREEFASILCHETAHDIDHDLIHVVAKDQQMATLIGLIGAFSGAVKTARGLYAENLAYAMQANSYALDVENIADVRGADTCAQAGYNPWGMVWLFQNFVKVDSGGSMEVLSDAESEVHRIGNLEAHFDANPQLFAAFPSNGATATALLP
jgi:beta-barrel assembly-enhancing protease